jgi:hypothetical protein
MFAASEDWILGEIEIITHHHHLLGAESFSGSLHLFRGAGNSPPATEAKSENSYSCLQDGATGPILSQTKRVNEF